MSIFSIIFPGIYFSFLTFLSFIRIQNKFRAVLIALLMGGIGTAFLFSWSSVLGPRWFYDAVSGLSLYGLVYVVSLLFLIKGFVDVWDLEAKPKLFALILLMNLLVVLLLPYLLSQVDQILLTYHSYFIFGIFFNLGLGLVLAYLNMRFRVEFDQALAAVNFLSSFLIVTLMFFGFLFHEPFLHDLTFIFILPYVMILYFIEVKKHVILLEDVLKNIFINGILISLALLIYSFLYWVSMKVFMSEAHFSNYFSLFIVLLFSYVYYLPFRKRIESFLLGLYFFRPLINYHLLFRTFSSVILSLVDLDKILDLSVKFLSDAYGVEKVNCFIKKKEDGSFFLKEYVGSGLQKEIYQKNDPLIHTMQRRLPVVGLASIKNRVGKENYKLLKEEGIDLLLSFEAQGELIGFIMLGHRSNQLPFKEEDVEVLEVFCNQISVSLNNALFFRTEKETYELIAQRNKMDAIMALSSGINHEINNPLSIISMKCQNFMRKMNHRLFESEEEELKSARDIIQSCLRNVDRAHKITRKLSNFAKPMNDAADFKLIDIKEIVDETLELVGPKQLEADNVLIQVDFPEKLSRVYFDRSHLQQIVFNLVINAYHAIGMNGEIKIWAVENDNNVVLYIQDDGCGIPKEKLDKIWEPFFTTKPENPTKESKFSGTGLGLALVRRYIENTDGEIEVTSEPGKGTTFELSFLKIESTS